MGVVTADGRPPSPSIPRSFDQFFASEYRVVLRLALVLTGRRATAEDLTQEGFARAFLHWDRISRYDNPGAWVRRVVMNLATSAGRRAGREARALARLAERGGAASVTTVSDDAFWAAVRALPRRQRECVALHYLEDRSTAHIAAVLGIAEATVRVHLHGGRTALATALGESLEDER